MENKCKKLLLNLKTAREDLSARADAWLIDVTSKAFVAG